MTGAGMKAGNFVLGGEVEAPFDFLYRAPDDTYLFDFPFEAQFRAGFKAERVEALLSLKYLDELGLGESYLLGGSENSNMKIGYYVEDWGIGYSTGLPTALNYRDERYPDNIFFSKEYMPNPLLVVTMGGSSFRTQFALSQREQSVESVDDADVGVRGVVAGQSARVSAGFTRKIGGPPPLFFLNVEQKTENGRVWTEVDWKYLESSADGWNFVLGLRRELFSATLHAEYLLLDTEDILFLEEDITLSDALRFDFRAYFHFPDFSTALSGFFILDLGSGFTFEPGFYGFIGKSGRYFSPLEDENDNRAELKLRFVF